MSTAFLFSARTCCEGDLDGETKPEPNTDEDKENGDDSSVGCTDRCRFLAQLADVAGNYRCQSRSLVFSPAKMLHLSLEYPHGTRYRRPYSSIWFGAAFPWMGGVDKAASAVSRLFSAHIKA